MSKNTYSEIGIAEELIRSYVQFGCAEIHAVGLFYKANAEIENGMIDVSDSDILAKHAEKIEQYQKDIDTYANLRRSVMRCLFDMFNGDKDMWCEAKHLGIGAMQLFEAYEASDNDMTLLMLCVEANKAFTHAMTRFLGTEVTDCASCFSDMLKEG